jgi:chromosomal replication initiation ATPase DnaA
VEVSVWFNCGCCGQRFDIKGPYWLGGRVAELSRYCESCWNKPTKKRHKPLTPEQVDEIVENCCVGVTLAAVKGQRRHGWLIEPRFRAMYRLRQKGMMLKEIGLVFDGRNHASIVHAIAVAERKGWT